MESSRSLPRDCSWRSTKAHQRSLTLLRTRLSMSSSARRGLKRPCDREIVLDGDLGLWPMGDLVGATVPHFVEGKHVGLNGPAHRFDRFVGCHLPTGWAGYTDNRWRNRIPPLVAKAVRTFRDRSSGYATVAVAAYGIRWAAMIPMMSFLGRGSGRSLGVVVVQVPVGVAEDRWIPVFIYASLS